MSLNIEDTGQTVSGNAEHLSEGVHENRPAMLERLHDCAPYRTGCVGTERVDGEQDQHHTQDGENDSQDAVAE